jgi:hypothetical protein
MPAPSLESKAPLVNSVNLLVACRSSVGARGQGHYPTVSKSFVRTQLSRMHWCNTPCNIRVKVNDITMRIEIRVTCQKISTVVLFDSLLLSQP